MFFFLGTSLCAFANKIPDFLIANPADLPNLFYMSFQIKIILKVSLFRVFFFVGCIYKFLFCVWFLVFTFSYVCPHVFKTESDSEFLDISLAPNYFLIFDPTEWEVLYCECSLFVFTNTKVYCLL